AALDCEAAQALAGILVQVERHEHDVGAGGGLHAQMVVSLADPHRLCSSPKPRAIIALLTIARHCRVKGSGAIAIEVAAPDRRMHRMTYRAQMRRRWDPRRAGVALIAAYALALQALFASFGVGAALVRHQATAIAGVVCPGGGAASMPVPVAPAEHDGGDCCVQCGTPVPALVGQISALTLAIEGLPSRLAAPRGVDHHA